MREFVQISMFASELHALMSENLWECFAKQYCLCARGNGCRVGYMDILTVYVKEIVRWYKQNQSKVDALCCDDKQQYHWTLWLEFKEMWIDSSSEDQKQFIKLIPQLVDSCNLYQIWCQLKTL